MTGVSAENDLFFFQAENFARWIEALGPGYAKAKPFPHAVIDDFLPDAVARRIAAEFPAPGFKSYKQPDNAYQVGKLGRVQENDFVGVPAFTRHILNEFNGKVFLDFLERLTGITGLIADPHFQGGALHQILPGGKLAVHADFNWDPRRHLDRRLNVLVYFNDEWREEYGGHLELWDERMSRCEARIVPRLNRCVIFSTTSTSYHGHPEPLRCPPDRTRNSIALYYYTNGRPKEERRAPHATLWRLRPGEPPPPGAASSGRASRLRHALRRLIPI